ncbi:hypothetical protein [Pedobacter jeongneungensis]|uniref:hypothetical protein n=1 Tax=Pedobacter jeongneungensis TaxID=947309 RepID=UPI00046940E3|nr:hypothetical protein [Pedobacter jeongneungensis]
MDQPTNADQQSSIPAGWVGGFSQNPPDQPYPEPDLLSSLKFQDNLDNISKINRMLRARWPEFSWEVKNGDSSTRMYQMFAPDISRLGYDNYGQVWSIICPQQGVYFPSAGVTMNIEVTVTGNRGWIDEMAPKNELFAADIKVKPTIWFSSDDTEGFLWRQLLKLNNLWSEQLPLSKAQGVRITTTGENGQDDFVRVTMGTYPQWPFPARADHTSDYAWAVAHLAVIIGGIVPSSDLKVHEFNTKVMELFNLGSGNLLQENTSLIWNLWAGSPELVDQQEWQNHATYWRNSIDVNHQPAEGAGTAITDINGNLFIPDQVALDLKIAEFGAWIAYQLL